MFIPFIPCSYKPYGLYEELSLGNQNIYEVFVDKVVHKGYRYKLAALAIKQFQILIPMPPGIPHQSPWLLW